MEREEIWLRKAGLRQQGLARRRAQPNKDEASRRILVRALGLPQYQRAQTVMFYVGVRSEVRTRDELFPEIPVDDHDVFLDAVITEEQVYS